MSKFLKEFKDFALRGNVVDMAVGVVIGAAFGKVVSSVVDIFIQPIVDSFKIVGENGVEATTIGGKLVGFAGVLVEFIITAFVLFLIIKAMNKAKNLTKKPEPPKEEPRKCPFCCSEIAKEATRCPHCTSELPKYKAA